MKSSSRLGERLSKKVLLARTVDIFGALGVCSTGDYYRLVGNIH